MRQTSENQLPLAPLWPDHALGEELQTISRILDENPRILDLILHDLSDTVDRRRGAPGLTAEQVLRCGLFKQLQQFSYRRLAISPGRLGQRSDILPASGGLYACCFRSAVEPRPSESVDLAGDQSGAGPLGRLLLR